MASQTPFIVVEIMEEVMVIKFNREEKRNALTHQMYEAVIEALRVAAVNDQIVMVVLTGTGQYYSSGADLENVFSYKDGDINATIAASCDTVRRFVAAFIDFPKILVALVNGPAIGIAVTTLGLCDSVYAADEATFQTPFTRLGFVAEGCSSYTFPRMLGQLKAMDMLAYNKKVSAADAWCMGLVTETFPRENLSLVLDALLKIAKQPSGSLFGTKQLIRQQIRDKLHRANDAEMKVMAERFRSEECFNAVTKYFAEKSKL